MLNFIILAISIVSQAIAFILAFQLRRITGWYSPWLLVSIAIALMIVRRIMPLFSSSAPQSPPTTCYELTGLVISVLLALGLWFIRPFFESAKRAEQALLASIMKETEAKSQLREINEQLNCANEKLASANEELGAANEELSAANEEVSDVNQELTAINEEMTATNDELIAANEALRESEKMLTEAHTMAQLGYWMWDIETGNVEWSDQVYKIFHLNPGIFTPQINSILDLSPWPEDHERDKELIRKAIEHQEKGDYEQRFLRPDNSIGYYYSTFHGIYDEEGNLLTIVGTIQDITERKQAEEALRESEAKYRQLIELASEGVWADDKDNVTTFVNSQMAKMLGYTQEDMIGHINTELMYEEDLVMGDKGILVQSNEIGDARRRGERSSYKQRFRRSDGTELWCIVSGTPILDDDGRYLGSFGMFTDITERKRAEETLAVSELRYRRLFESAKDGILIIDAETGIVDDVNPYLVSMLGYSSEHFLGKEIWDLAFFNAIVANREQFLELKQQEYVRYEDTPLDTADSKRIDVEFISNVYQVNLRKVIQCNIRDISERKQVERERAALEDQLRQSHKMEAIGTLAGGIAHDFNNLLFAILGNAELALDEIDIAS